MASMRLLLLLLCVLAAGCSHAGCSVESELTHSAPSDTTEDGMRVYRVGSSGPHLIVLHELPGLSPATFFLAEKLSENGYQVHLPLLFGDPGDSNGFTGFFKGCIGDRFNCRHREDPGEIVATVDALAVEIAAKHGGPVGVIGNCLTGSVAAAVLRKGGPVQAAVMSQPSLPFFRKTETGLGPKFITRIRESEVPILALRFSNDSISPPERMERFQRTFGSQLRVITIPSGCASPVGIPEDAHAVLTKEFSVIPGHPTRQAFEEVLAYLDSRLKGVRP